MRKKFLMLMMAGCLAAYPVMLSGCGSGSSGSQKTETQEETAEDTEDEESVVVSEEERDEIEEALDLKNMKPSWTYDSDADAWVMGVVTAVTKPEIEDQQGVSVCVPGPYVKGIDTDSDGKTDVKAKKAKKAVTGDLVIDNEAKITSTNGQEYTASGAPIILNTGAAGYGSSENTEASTTYAKEGYINVSCGNRGKQDSYEDEDGETVYTGDAPCCLVDQKNAIRFVRYNILIGNLPGSVDHVVSTGGSGGGAHAVMFAATSDSKDFYDYQIKAGAVGVYKDSDGNYSTSILANDEEVKISDGAWGCMAYSAITSLKEADMAMAMEYYLDKDYSFGSDFQKTLASYLSKEYMNYINDQNLEVSEEDVGLDINKNGNTTDTINLQIKYDEKKYKDTNGYGGTYLDFYLAEFISNLQWYIDNLDYADGWTWFNEKGKPLSDKKVKKMSSEDKAKAFLEGRYSKGSDDEKGMGPGGAPPEGADKKDLGGGPPDDGNLPDKTKDKDSSEKSDKNNDSEEVSTENSDVKENSKGDQMEVGTPDEGSTQSADGGVDSANYSSYTDMLKEYTEDIAEINEGDEFGRNITDLYDPLRYIGSKGTNSPVWARILMGAAEGDMPMFSSLNLQVKFLEAGTNCNVAWQWGGGHVPSEIFGDSLPLYVDQMYGDYVNSAKVIEKPEAEKQKKNGSESEASGEDITSWVDSEDLGAVSFKLKDAAAYRTAGASKAIPGFDVIDYGQEDYVFGSPTKDARHWDEKLLGVLKEQQETLEKLFNKEQNEKE